MAQTITVETRGKDAVVDITDEVARYLRGQEREDGVCLAFAAHTTCALTTADLDPGTYRDLLEALRKVLPAMRYRHPTRKARRPPLRRTTRPAPPAGGAESLPAAASRSAARSPPDRC